MDMVQIFPKADTGDEWKTQEHKWCVVITEKEIAEGLKAYLQEFSKKRLLHIDGDKEMENFKAPVGSLMNKISAAQIDNCTLYMNSIMYKNGAEVFFIFTGMGLKEVDKYYKEFLESLKDLKEEGEKK